ncbi:MAG: CRISPR-associated protein Csx15, partial [Anaerolineae bacterium]
MILLNFAHPITPNQRAQIEALTGHTIERIVDVDSQIDPQHPLVPQITAMIDETGLSPTEWQTLPLLVNPPALNFSAVALMAELHGRCGAFLPCLRLRPAANSLPRRYEVAEILDLQVVG